MNRLLLMLFCTICAFSLNAQSYTSIKTANKKQLKIYAEAKRNAFAVRYEAALKDLNKLLKSDASFIDAWILQAQIFSDQKKTEAAIKSFKKAIELDENYDIRLYYMLGVSALRSDAYQDATSYFQSYMDKNPKDEKRLDRAKKYIRQAAFSAEMVANPVPFDPQPMSAAINSPYGDYLPSLTADGETFIFSRRIGQQEDFYFSKLKDGVWQPSQALTTLNTPLNEGAQSIAADGRTIILGALYPKRTFGSFDLYIAESQNGDFSPPVNMGDKINSSAMDRQPSLSSDGKTLYFESKRGGGQGEGDIWKSERQADGTWGKAENLGAVVNTSGIDKAPFIHADGKTLYFMSNGHLGMGGFDLFLTRKQEDGSWSKPENLGYPINTKANEGALIVSLDGKTAYYTSDKNPPEYGGREDIYTFEMPEKIRPAGATYVKAIVRDAKTKRRIEGAKAEFITLQNATTHALSFTDSQGSFLTVLPVGEDYALNVSASGYLFHSENFSLETSQAPDEAFQLDVFLYPIPKETEKIADNQAITLNNIFFKSNEATLLPQSLIELQQLKRLLEEQASLRIQINGHTDNVGTEEDNLTLSENRAKAVHDYLISEGIDAKRLTYKGFGESQAIDDNATEIGRRNNRRTTFVILR